MQDGGSSASCNRLRRDCGDGGLRAARDAIRHGDAGIRRRQGRRSSALEQVRPAVERAFAAGVPYCLNVNIRGVRSPFTEWQVSGK